MGLGVVGHLVAHAGSECEFAPVPQLGSQLTFETEKNVSLGAPVIGKVAGRVFDHSNSNVSEMLGAPVGYAGFTLVFGELDMRPIRDAEGKVGYLHGANG